MRKRLIEKNAGTAAGRGTLAGEWLDLESLAKVEISSEDERFPIEQALEAGGKAAGWRAATTGPQTIRLRFDAPIAIHRIYLHFLEREVERAQEFAMYAGSGDGELGLADAALQQTDARRQTEPALRPADAALREIVRQQYSFSPGGSTEEIEDYSVDLKDVTVLELHIDPDRVHDPRQSRAHASLAALRLG
jgi:hypothetical protein